MTRQLLHSATLLTVDPQDRVIEDGWLVIEDGRIAGARAGREQARSRRASTRSSIFPAIC